MIELLGILLPLGLLMYFAFRGITLLLLAPVMAVFAVVLSGGLSPLAAFTQIFMINTADFILAFFPLFFLGAIFGKLMDDSGSAESIARWVIGKLGMGNAMLAVVICCAVLTYGGVSLFVVAFAIFPIASALFRDAAVPKRLIPGAIALGAFTFTMSALPGTPAIQNAIPMPYFGTTAFAAPGLGIIAAIMMFGLGMLWLNHRASAALATGEGYGNHDDGLPEPDTVMRAQAQNEGFDVNEIEATEDTRNLPPFILAIAPIVIVVLVNFLFVEFVVPQLETAYLAEPLFGATSIEAVRGVWAIVVALTASILFLILSNFRRFPDIRETLNKGADAAVLPIFNTASLVGFGGVIAALPAFGEITDGLMSLSDGNPLVSVAMSVTTLSALTGSASGGMSIALDALGSTFVAMANATGTSLEAMHRVTSVASGALDALPHNGAVITVLGIAKLTHKDSYLDIFVTAVIVPFIALVAIIVLANLFGGF
ncbi:MULTISPECIES: GntP family permease [Stappiaceae]|uniref:GntP family permease n=1 Tax=Stappiaceae TaxID=2821832 RepID=UPI0012693127|nr:Citrate transporter [Labrenzia sp. THAF82]